MTSYLLNMSKTQKETLESLKQQTGVQVAELLRRMITYTTSSQDRLNEIVPLMSGKLFTQGDR